MRCADMPRCYAWPRAPVNDSDTESQVPKLRGSRGAIYRGAMDPDKLSQNWPALAVAAVVGVGIGYALGAKITSGSTSKRERAACDSRVAAAERQARRTGIVDARRASDAAMNDLVARSNPYLYPLALPSRRRRG